MANSASAIRAGKAFIELFVDDNRLVRGLNAAAARLKAFGGHVRSLGTAMVGIGAAAMAPLVASVKMFASSGAGLDDMAKRTGFSAESLAELGFAAEQSGATLQSFESSVKRLQRTIGDATEGSTSSADALKGIGLAVEDIAALSPDAQFEAIADRISQIPDPTLRAAAAMRIFGRSGTDLLPLMENGAAGIRALRDEARALGIVLSSGDVAKAAELDDAIAKIVSQTKGTFLQIGAALAQPALELAGALSKVLTRLIAWVKENRGLVVSIAKVTAGIVLAGGAIVGLGIGIQVIGFALGGLAVVAGIAAKAFLLLWATLTGPVGLAAAAVIGLAGVLLNYTAAGRQALANLRNGFEQVKRDAQDAFAGIADALATGNIAAAAKILWLTLKLEWTRGVAALHAAMLPIKNFATDVFWGTAAVANNAWASIESGWLATTSFMSQAWISFTGALQAGWNITMGYLETAWTRLKGMFDEGIDVEAEVRRIDARVGAANRSQVAVTREQLKAVEDRRAARARQIERDRQAGALGTGRAGAEARSTNAEALTTAARELEQATAAFRQSITEARDNRGTFEREQARKNAEEAAVRATGASESRGLFNVGHWQKLGGGVSGSLQERIARATEETARNTDDIFEAVTDNGPRWE